MNGDAAHLVNAAFKGAQHFSGHGIIQTLGFPHGFDIGDQRLGFSNPEAIVIVVYFNGVKNRGKIIHPVLQAEPRGAV